MSIAFPSDDRPAMTPPAFPDAARAALLVVDVQDRLLGAMPQGGAHLVHNASVLLRLARALDWPLVYSEQYPKGLGSTAGALLPLLDGATRVEKTHFSCVRDPVFASEVLPTLPHHLVVVGMETHVCVLQTVADMQARGHQCFVPQDAVASRTDANRVNGLDLIRQGGAVVTNVESLLFGALERAGTPLFKQLAPLIR